MRVLTPMLLLVGCRVPSVESFTGLALTPRATQQRQARPTSLPTTTGVRQRHQQQQCSGVTTAVMMAKPTEAALIKEKQADPAVVEAALVEEDKNV